MSAVYAGRFAGSAMLITGGGSGIGRATAVRAAAEGASVAVLDIDGDAAAAVAGEILATGGEAMAVTADITRERMVEDAVARAQQALGPLGVLVNNAGAARTRTFAQSDPTAWRADLDLNLTGHWLATRALLPGFLAQGRGTIVNVATVNALTSVAEPAYSAAKAGLLQLTRQLAATYGGRGIRANAVIPGSIRTPIWNARLAEQPDVLDRVSAWYPVGRVGEPEDVAAAILFLASAEAGFITGASLVVDGGLTSGLVRLVQDLADEEPSPQSNRSLAQA